MLVSKLTCYGPWGNDFLTLLEILMCSETSCALACMNIPPFCSCVTVMKRLSSHTFQPRLYCARCCAYAHKYIYTHINSPYL